MYRLYKSAVWPAVFALFLAAEQEKSRSTHSRQESKLQVGGWSKTEWRSSQKKVSPSALSFQLVIGPPQDTILPTSFLNHALPPSLVAPATRFDTQKLQLMLRSTLVEVDMSSDGMSPGTGVTAHLFAPVQAPRLASISRTAIQDFLANRHSYVDAVAAQRSLNAVSWRSSFLSTFLWSLFFTNVWSGGHWSFSANRRADQSQIGNINRWNEDSFCRWSSRGCREKSPLWHHRSSRTPMHNDGSHFLPGTLQEAWMEIHREGTQGCYQAHNLRAAASLPLGASQEASELEQSDLEDKCFEFM